MGSVIADGIRAAGAETTVVEKDPDRVAGAAKAGHQVAVSPEQAAIENATTILAVKPQDFLAMAAVFGLLFRDRPVISVMAGVPITLISQVCYTSQVARIMPNLAGAFGKAAVGLSFAEEAGEALREAAQEVAASLGSVTVVPESNIPAVTGISGSGIAFVFSFIHGLALGGTRAGIAYPQALGMALDVVEGAATALRRTGIHPSDYASRVASPAGTTIEGLTVLEERGFTGTVVEAVMRAAGRAAELEKELVESASGSG